MTKGSNDAIELFSDIFSHKQNWLSSIDTRAKLLFVFIALILNISSHTVFIPGAFILLSLALLKTVNIPARLLIYRLIAPYSIAGVIILLQIFFHGATPLFRFNLFGITITGYEEGLIKGLLIGAKVLSAVSLILLLSMTTPVNRLLQGLAFFRFPKGWIEVAIFTYRYIFVFIEDAVTVYNAQKLRLGYINPRIGLKSFGTLTGTLMSRAYDQAINTSSAALLRGYKGEMPVYFKEKFKRSDLIVCLIIFGFILFIMVGGYIWKLL